MEHLGFPKRILAAFILFWLIPVFSFFKRKRKVAYSVPCHLFFLKKIKIGSCRSPFIPYCPTTREEWLLKERHTDKVKFNTSYYTSRSLVTLNSSRVRTLRSNKGYGTFI
ncbi:hypothetical protein CLU79DRAFT_759413 [Phycomyces nitens]|nr:hypothetical protein CLU79DRAFT_759413 [Phycomyces nitens]